jgi:hypothetical protein
MVAAGRVSSAPATILGYLLRLWCRRTVGSRKVGPGGGGNTASQEGGRTGFRRRPRRRSLNGPDAVPTVSPYKGSGQGRGRTLTSEPARYAAVDGVLVLQGRVNASATGREHYTQTGTWKRSGDILKTATASICLQDQASGAGAHSGLVHFQSSHPQEAARLRWDLPEG